jgi:hypothetical protein
MTKSLAVVLLALLALGLILNQPSLRSKLRVQRSLHPLQRRQRRREPRTAMVSAKPRF